MEPGARVIVLGGPLGLSGSLSEGIVSAIRDPAEVGHDAPGAVPLLQITAAISPGSSGSPVMTLGGKVIGVVVSQFWLGQNLNFAVPVSELTRLLERDEAGSEEQSFAAIQVSSRTTYVRNIVVSGAFLLVLLVALKRLK